MHTFLKSGHVKLVFMIFFWSQKSVIFEVKHENALIYNYTLILLKRWEKYWQGVIEIVNKFAT